MKVQIIGYVIGPNNAMVKLQVGEEVVQIQLPTHKAPTLRELKRSIASTIKTMSIMKSRFAILKKMMFEEIDIDVK